MHCTCRSLIVGAFSGPWQRSAAAPLAFLLPNVTATKTAPFSSSAPHQSRRRGRGDGNPWRGISVLRHTGLPKGLRLSVNPRNLPEPVLDPERRSRVQGDEDHGLWEFFNAKRTLLTTPLDVVAHGRAWTAYELRRKDWDDLHCLWWVCVKEKNRMATELKERHRLGNMYGDQEHSDRLEEIKKTMKAIKYTLTERFYAWENARVEAMKDPKIDLSKIPQISTSVSIKG